MENINQQKKELPQYISTGKSLLELNIDSIPFLVEGLIQKTGLAALGGSSDTGKSTLLRQLAMDVALGNPEFIGFKLNTIHKRAIYISTEDDIIATAYLLKQQKQGEFEAEKLKDLLYIFDSENLILKLEQCLLISAVDVVIVDAFADIFTGDFNGVGQVRNYLQQFSNLAAKYECLILFLHHTSKKAENQIPSKTNLLGSQGFEAKMRWVGELRRDPNDNELRHLCVVKGNYIKDEDKESSHELIFKDRQFHRTNNRVPFAYLLKDKSNDDERNALMFRIGELKSSKYSARKASDQLRSEGFDVGKSTVNNLYKMIDAEEFIEAKVVTDESEEIENDDESLDDEDGFMRLD